MFSAGNTVFPMNIFLLLIIPSLTCYTGTYTQGYLLVSFQGTVDDFCK